MIFVIFGGEIPSETPKMMYEVEREALPVRFDIAIKSEEESEFQEIAKCSECFDISAPDHYPHFSGEIRYRATFVAKDGFDVVDFGQVGDTCEVWLNGKYLGARINLPYKFNMVEAIKNGENELEIVVKSNPAHRRPDGLSSYMQIPPSGIIGEIALCKYQ